MSSRGDSIDVISVTPAMRPNCRSSGVATEVAIVSGSPRKTQPRPEWWETRPAGAADTGSNRKATAPASAAPNVRSVVATGLSNERAEKTHGAHGPSRYGATFGTRRNGSRSNQR